jgi:uncharacterized protein
VIELTLLGLAVGVLMGLTGAGGGVLAVPGLMLVLNWEVAQAAPLAMLSVMMSAGLGAYGALRDKLARYKAAMLMSVVAMPFSSLGIQLAQWFRPALLSGLFAAILLYIAARQVHGCFRHGAADVGGNDAVLCHMNWETGKLSWNWLTAVVIAGIGAVTGFLTGLLGVGGAFFMVPMLGHFTNIPLQGVIATVLLVMALISAGSLILAHLHGVAIPVALAAPFVAGAMAGMLVGRHYVKRFSPRALQCSFGLLVLAVGLGVAARTLLAP